MFQSNKIQYVNIIQEENTLKVDYILQDNKSTIKEESSSFLLYNETISKDVIFKLESLQKETLRTYLTALYTSQDQIVVERSSVNKSTHKAIALDDKYSISIAKTAIKQKVESFQTAGLDYLISPFTILNEHLKSNYERNSLNIFLYNDKLYIIISNNNQDIVQSFTIDIVSICNIKESNFNTQENQNSELYSEMYFLELEQKLNDIIEEYYSSNKGIEFFEKINIFHSKDLLTNEQIESLSDTLLVQTTYKSIDMNNTLKTLLAKPNIKQYSFTEPRVKKSTYTILLWIILLLVSVGLVGSILYSKITEPKTLEEIVKVKQVLKQQEKIIDQEIKPKAKEEVIVIKLPNHNLQNTTIIDQTLVFFDLVAYDSVLLELAINKNSSTFVSNFTLDSNSSNVMISELSNFYEESKIILQHKNNGLISTIISNNGYKIISEKNKASYLTYKHHDFYKIPNFTQFLKTIVLKDSDIKYISSVQEKYLTYQYTVISNVKTPEEFFKFVALLNQKQISLNINYPIEFAKTNEGIEVKFNLEFHQQIKK